MGDPGLLPRLQAILETSSDGGEALSLASLEDSLTDGYALALALEAERARTARRIGELAAREGDDAEEKTRELTTLSQRLAGAETELASLRPTLVELRRRATALRTAAVLG